MSDMMGSEGKGFSFDLVRRNDLLAKKGITAPKAWKTGTTLAGVVFKDGVVVASDTRATSGDIVADKNILKIHCIAPNIYCAGAGTAADCNQVARMTASALTLHRYETGRESRVVTSLTIMKTHLRKYNGHISAALLLGGIDINGPQIYTIFPHGSTDSLPFATFGSGSLNAMSVFEADFKEDMTEEEAIELVCRAIKAGVYNDLASGSNVDIAVITREDVKFHRNYDLLMGKTYTRQKPVNYPPGTTVCLDERIKIFKDLVIVDGDEMDTT